MKLALLMTMLAANGLLAVEFDITAEGTLTCPYPFFARVKVEELDFSIFNPDDLIGIQEFQPIVGKHSIHFKISGKAEDSIGQDKVEPRVIISHTCGGEARVLCKEYSGVTPSNSKVVLNADLSKPDLGNCS